LLILILPYRQRKYMPLQKLQFRPGLNREGTDYSNEGGWYDADKVRFRSGFPEKIGGWTRMANAQFLGLARSLWNWVTLSGSNYLGVGTNIKYYIEQGGTYNDVTPVVYFSSPALDNCFVVTSGSNVVTVIDGQYSPSIGDYVTFSGANTVTGTNITNTILNQEYVVSSTVNTVAYRITVSVTANANATGGGNTVIASYQQPIGLNTYTLGTGWGAGPWPVTGVTTSLTNPFATTNGSNSVVVTQTAHGLSNGQAVIFANATATGGVSAVLLNTLFYPTVANANAYTITVQANATSTTTGGGNVIAYTESGTHGWGEAFTSGIGQQLRLWTNDNYGQQLFIAPRGGAVYYWIPAGEAYPSAISGGLTTRAQRLSTQSTAAGYDGTRVPTATFQVLSSAIQRFIICMGANPYDPTTANTTFDSMLVRWSDQENPYEWVPAVTNQSGEFRLSNGSFIMGARATRQEILVWTDAAIYSMQYLGPPYIWGFQILMDNISIMSPNSMITVNNVTYWMGVDKFYMYSGRVETLPCSLWQYIFDDINKEQAFQVFCGGNESYNEVWWFYCSTSSNVIDKYVIYNYLERTWYYGSMTRTAWLDSGLRQYPMAADYNNRMLFHESAVDDVSGTSPVPINAYIQSSDFDIGDGHNFGFVWRILPDVNFNGSNVNNPYVTMRVKPRQNSGAPYGTADNPEVISGDNFANAPVYNIQEFTGQVYTRLRGRQLAFRIESDSLGVAWQLGSPRIDIRNDGRR
jgi:hypothetical protein